MISQYFSLVDRVAIITGGGKGIGADIARVFAEAGATCVLSGRHLVDLEAVCAELPARGRSHLAVVADVRDQTQVDNLVQRTLDSQGRIDILVNNAGGSYMFPLAETPIDKWDNNINLNLRGPFMLTQAAGLQMIKQGGGSIINISSMAGVHGVRGGVAYSAAKCGLQMMTRVVAAEWGCHGIRANCIAPGMIASEGALRSWARAGFDTAEAAAGFPLKRLGTPRDIAMAALFFASDASSYISGETLAVCGGPTMGGLAE